MAKTNSPYSPEDFQQFDFGPWIESPESSRVTRYRYDYANRALQVEWKKKNGHLPGTTYMDAGSDVYRRLARSASKGKFVNRVLNGFSYRPTDPAENYAPSNPSRSTVQHR